MTSVTISGTEWLALESQRYFPITVTPQNATWQDRDHFKWSSSNTEVVTINADGLITAVGTGSAIITAKHKGFSVSDSFVVTVGQVFDNGLYVVKNASSKKYMEVENASTKTAPSTPQFYCGC